jgi:hypothetical protein
MEAARQALAAREAAALQALEEAKRTGWLRLDGESADAYAGVTPDGLSCHHRHRSPQAAAECAARSMNLKVKTGRKAEAPGKEAVRYGTTLGRTRYLGGPVTDYKVTQQKGVSFTVKDAGAGQSLDVMVPDDAPEQLLNLHNGDVVRISLNDALTGIEDFELCHYADGSEPRAPRP